MISRSCLDFKKKKLSTIHQSFIIVKLYTWCRSCDILYIVCCYKDLAMNIFRVKLWVCLFSREYHTIQYNTICIPPMCILEYCISIDWMDSPILSSIHHARIIYKVLSNICTFGWCSLSCFFILNSISVFCALMLSLIDPEPTHVAQNIKDKNRLRQLDQGSS